MDFSIYYRADAPMVVPYSLPHIIYLLVCFSVIFLFIKNYKKVKENKDFLRKVFLGILTFQQIFLLYGWYALMTGFDLAESLPFQICRVASILTFFFLIKEDTRFLDVIFYFSVFALSSFFYPLGVYNFTHVNGLSYMINHLLTVIIPIFGVIAYDWRPSWSACRRATLSFIVYLTIVYFLNPYVNGNYFYLVRRPFLHSWSYTNCALLSLVVTICGFSLITVISNYIVKLTTPKINK